MAVPPQRHPHPYHGARSGFFNAACGGDWREPHEAGVDGERRGSLANHASERRHDPRNRRKHAKPHGQRERRQQRGAERDEDEDRAAASVRKVLGVRFSAVRALPMMLGVHAFVEECRNQQRHADERTARKPEPRHVASSQVRELVDEQDSAVQREHRDREERRAVQRGSRGNGPCKRRPADRRRGQQIGPIDGARRPEPLDRQRVDRLVDRGDTPRPGCKGRRHGGASCYHRSAWRRSSPRQRRCRAGKQFFISRRG